MCLTSFYKIIYKNFQTFYSILKSYCSKIHTEVVLCHHDTSSQDADGKNGLQL